MLLHKAYQLEKSPFYRVGTKRRLCCVLNTTPTILKQLLRRENYWIYEQASSRNAKKVRKIYAPKPAIKQIQKRLQTLLSRISLPQYVFSGRKGLCYIDNAKFHQTAKHALTIDIREFYTSTRKEYIFKLFRYRFKMAEDVAWLIADITTYHDFLPTGSPASQLVAFLAYQDTFDRIEKVAKDNNTIFSLFVDDMTFSSIIPFKKDFPFLIQQELKKVRLEINSKKTKRYTANDHKLVTGCIITPDNALRVRNRQRIEILKEFSVIHQEDKNAKKIKSLLGKINSAKQIQHSLFTDQYRYLAALDKQLS